MKKAAHVDERLHEHDEEGVHTEWERKQVVLPSRGIADHKGPGHEGPTGRRRTRKEVRELMLPPRM